MTRKLLMVGLMVGACVSEAANSVGEVRGERLVLNGEEIPAWDFPTDPTENWRFFPLEWQTVPLIRETVENFELNAVFCIGEYRFSEPPYDTAHYTRTMNPAQFHFQGGLVLRDHGVWNRYRLQFSVKEKCVALWKTPGNFLAVGDCPLEQGRPFHVRVRAVSDRFTVEVDGRQLFEVEDRFDPLGGGPILAGANHAHVEVWDWSVKPLTGESRPGEERIPHRPSFSVRSWCGSRWIFDGIEPVARLGEGRNGKAWPGFPVALMSAKLRPGTLEADTIPLQFRGAGNWPEKTMEIRSVSSKRVQLRAHTSDRREGREPTVQTVCDLTLEYQPDWDSYVYTLETIMTYLRERKPVIEIMDPWPLWVCGPAPGASRPWPMRYRDILWCAAEDNRWYRYPLVHFLSPIIVPLSRERPVVCYSGERDVNPTYEILPPSSERPFKIGLCNVMLDLHIQQSEAPSMVPAGFVQHDAWRIFSTHGERLSTLQAGDSWHPAWGSQTNRVVALFDSRGTVFSGAQIVPILERRAGQAFTPAAYYTLDPEMGYSDTGSLRMEEQKGSRTVMVREGPSYFSADYDGRPRRLRFYVRSEDLKGTFQVRVERYPRPADGPAVFTGDPITGTSPDWQVQEILCFPQPGDHFLQINLILKAEQGGKGIVWVDDLSLTPCEEFP